MENLYSELLDDFKKAIEDNQRLSADLQMAKKNTDFWRENYFYLRSSMQDLLEKEPELFEES